MTTAIEKGLLAAWRGPYAREYLTVRDVGDRLAHLAGRDLTRAAVEAARRLVNAGLSEGILEAKDGDGPLEVRPAPTEAPVHEEHRARSTGTTVQVIDNRGGLFDSSDPEGEPWYLLCVDHGGVASFKALRHARGFCGHPEEWCPTCQNGA